MGHKYSYRELKAAAKETHAKMAEITPNEKARKYFHTPAYQAGRLVREQGRQMQNRTLRELLDYLLDGVENGGMEGKEPLPEEVVEFIHGGRVDVAERYGIGGVERGQDSPD